jgi:transglutaminase-like putative cysteine protease
MGFEVSCSLDYVIHFPSTLILNVHAQRSASQSILEERFSVEPHVKVEEFTAEESANRFIRLETGKKKQLSIAYEATVDCQYQVIAANKIDYTPVIEMDRKAIPYLFPSRYCQSDRLSRLAWDMFGKIINPYEKVVAIVDWIHANVEYVRGSTNSETSAYDTVTQRTGVCRDFAHLGISLCRALNISARAPVLVLRRRTLGDDGTVKEAGRVWFCSDAYEFVCSTGRPVGAEGLFDIRNVAEAA